MSDQSMPIRLTPAAIAHLIRWIKKEAGAGVFVGVKKQGCSGLKYVVDVVSAGMIPDNVQVFEIDAGLPGESRVMLFLDRESLIYLKDICIDYTKPDNARDLLQGPRLVFVNPNQKGACGCGESFYV